MKVLPLPFQQCLPSQQCILFHHLTSTSNRQEHIFFQATDSLSIKSVSSYCPSFSSPLPHLFHNSSPASHIPHLRIISHHSVLSIHPIYSISRFSFLRPSSLLSSIPLSSLGTGWGEGKGEPIPQSIAPQFPSRRDKNNSSLVIQSDC